MGSSWKIVRGSQLGPTCITHGQTHLGPMWAPRTKRSGSHLGCPSGTHLAAHLGPKWGPCGIPVGVTTRHCQECSSRDMQQVGKQQKAYYFTIYIDLYSRQLSRTFHSPTMYYPKVVEAPWQQATDYISSSTWVIYQCGWAGG